MEVAMVQIHTRNFGDIEISDDKILEFPSGVPGFPDSKRYALIADPDDLENESESFYWLQSLDETDVVFCLIDLHKFLPDYDPLVDEGEIACLSPYGPEELLVYNIVVIPENPSEMTVNMKAPIVINPNTKTGIQTICQNEDYAVKYRLFNQ